LSCYKSVFHGLYHFYRINDGKNKIEEQKCNESIECNGVEDKTDHCSCENVNRADDEVSVSALVLDNEDVTALEL